MRKMTKRSIAITTATVVAVGGGAAAWAAWSVSNSATASVSSGSAAPVLIEGAVLTGQLIPGPGTGVQFTVRNNNPFRVHVTGATIDTLRTTKSGCSNTNFLPGPGTLAAFVLPANGGAETVTWNSAIKLKDSPDNACQNAPVTFSLNVNAESLDN